MIALVSFTYTVDPADVGADSGEDGGLLEVVATHTGAEADHTMDVPGAISVLAVQRTTRVSLRTDDTHDLLLRGRAAVDVPLCHLHCSWPALRLLRHRSCWWSQGFPTSRGGSRCYGPPQGVEPAEGCQRWDLQLNEHK